MLAGESRVKTQAAELEALKAGNRELEAALAAAQVGLVGGWVVIVHTAGCGIHLAGREGRREGWREGGRE